MHAEVKLEIRNQQNQNQIETIYSYMTGFPPTLQAHRLEIRGGAEGTDLQIGVHRTRERCRRGLAPPATAGMLPGRHR